MTFGEGFVVLPPAGATSRPCDEVQGASPTATSEIALNFITPHQKWGIHSAYSDNLMMLTLNRGGPVIWLSEGRRQAVPASWTTTGSKLFNANGAIAARAVVSQRVNARHGADVPRRRKRSSTPRAQRSAGTRGGIHNSVTRVVLKPTHMIGGYAQYSYGFNYYGTIGTNRDEFVLVRKIDRVDWLDAEVLTPAHTPDPARRKHDENSRTNRHGAEPGQVHWLPHLLGHLQERLDQPPRRGIRLVQQRGDQARHRLPQGVGEPGQVERRLGAQRRRLDRPAPGRQVEAAHAASSPTPTCRRSTTTTSPSRSTTTTCSRRRDARPPTARPRSLITGKRMEKIEWGPNWEEILGGEFSKRSKDKNFDEVQKEIYGQFENTFMMYLPRLCEHCLNPACVASCPSGSIYKREEDGIVLIDQDKCRGWRMCVSGCPYKKIYYNWQVGQGREVHLLLPAHRGGPAHGVLGNLRGPHPLPGRAAV